MGVINNLIQIRKNFKSIVGGNWDGTTIEDILESRPLIRFVIQPVDTDSDTVRIAVNTYGFVRYLQKKGTDGTWSNVGSLTSTAYATANVSLSAITETSVCRFAAAASGGMTDRFEYSNEFTVTRTEAQTQSLKAQAMKENLSETTDLKSEDI